MITIFTTPKDFIGHFDVIQSNAIQSWRKISDEIEIIIFGNSRGSKEIAGSINGIYIDYNRTNEFNTPYLDDMFEIAQNISKYDIMCYVNSDIILPSNFLNSVSICSKKYSKFLMVGYRWNLDLKTKINFDDKVENKQIFKLAKETALKSIPSCIDYHVFTKYLWKKIPEFLVGRTMYDNWLIWKTRRKMVPVIDATENIFVIHQEHDYSTIKTAINKLDRSGKSYEGSEQAHNFKFLGNDNFKTLNLLDCSYKIIDCKIVKNNSDNAKRRYLHRLPKVFPELAIPIKIFRRIYWKYLILIKS